MNIIPPEEQLFRAAVFLSVAWTVLMTGFTTLGAVLYNLISDVVGGIEVIVLEETGNVAYVAPTPQQSTPSPVAVPESTDPDVSIADVPTEAIWE